MTQVRECPCKMPDWMKQHGRCNPTTGTYIIMCTDHARRHDAGEGFYLKEATNGHDL